MSFYKLSSVHLLFFFIISASCSSHVENLASEAYEPIIPQTAKTEQHLKPSGGIYTTQGGGLFATDRRASAVGDILTVQLTENFAASKSQSASAAKSSCTNNSSIPSLLISSMISTTVPNSVPCPKRWILLSGDEEKPFAEP